MRAKFVNESLDRFALLNNDFLAENVLNEKLDINAITNQTKKLGVLASMFLMFAVGKAPDMQSKLPEKSELEKTPMLINMAQEDHLSRDDVFNGFDNMLDLFKKEEPKLFSAGDVIPAKAIPLKNKSFIEAVNGIKFGRLDPNKIDQYDQYDEAILKAAENLKAKGEKVNADFLKAIMIIETGMNPVKNKWGFEGFPQTKIHTIESINERNGTNFTMEDMYDAEKAAEFIHYYLKTVEKSKHVNSLEDMIIAYNWGIGNLGKYKRGEKELANQPKDYVKMFKAMEKHFVSQT